ncbi:hypothetical protein BH23BAC2_BH23BAC2_27640 [soil metagenome]
MKHHLLFTIYLCYFSASVTYGQVTTSLGMEGQAGWIIPHAEELRGISARTPIGLQLSYSRLNTSKENWDICNCFHYLGFQLSYHDFRNSEILGQATSLSTFFEPILAATGKWEFTLKNGMGISYLNKVYDEETNPENTFFSNPLSFLLFVQPKVNYHINDQLDGNVSFIFNHISNGGQSQPNRGMNFPMIGIGLSYIMDRQKMPHYEMDEIGNRLNIYMDAFSTTRKGRDIETRHFLIGASLGTYYQLFPISGLGAGIELYNDPSLLEQDDSSSSSFLAGPYIAHHLIIGRFDFSQRFAYYFQKPDNYIDNSFYQRYIIQYNVWENLQFGIGLKVHGHVAENLDFRLGWKF